MKRMPRALLCALFLLSALFLLTACNNGPENSEASSHITRSETYAEQGQYRSAILELKNAIQKEPNNVAFRVILAELYLDIGAHLQAERILQPLLNSHPEQVTLTLAKAYSAQGKHLSANETIASFSPKTDAEKLQASLIKAHSLRHSGETTAALSRFTALQKEHPESPEVAKGQILSQLMLGQSAAANEIAETWLANNGPNPDILFLKGMAYYRVNDLENAVATLTDAVGTLPSADVFLPIRRDILKLLSRTLTEQGKVTEAQVYNRVLADNTDSESQDQAQAAITAIKENRLDDAKQLLEDILKLNPDNGQVALLLGTVAIRQGNVDEGLSLLTENIDPETSPTPFIQATTVARVDRGERSDALKTLSRAIKARPKDTALLIMHGILALTLPEHEAEGEANLNKALIDEPENTGIRLALARYYLSRGRSDDALTQMRTAFTNDPAQWSATGTYLSLLLQGSLISEARDVKESLLNGYPQEPAAILLAGIAEAGLGNIDGAIARLEALMKERPDSPQPQMVLAQLYSKKGQDEKAINTLINAAKLAPVNITALQQASKIFARGHTLESTIKWLDDIGDEYPALAPNTTALAAIAELRQSKLEDARIRLAKADDRDTHPILQYASAELLISEAEHAIQEKNWQLARAKTAEAVALQPNNQRIALAQVRIPLFEGKPENALPVLNELEKTFGATTHILGARAEALLAAGNTADAINQYELILKRQSNHISALNNLAWLLKESDQRRALELASKASDLAPKNAAVLDTYGWILHLQGQHEKALTVSEKAYALAPNNEEIKKHMDMIEQAL